MKILNLLAWGLAATCLAGCSTPIGPLSPPPVPANPEQAASVTVYRATSQVDDALRMIFKINGEPTYQLFSGGRYQFALGAGSYELGYRLGMKDCSTPVDIDAGGSYVFKLGSDCSIILESQ